MKETLLEKLENNSIPIPECGCWLWIAFCGPTGYGRVSALGKTWQAHRLSWTVFKGPIPEGLVACHKCDTPGCINPEHLFLGTVRDNSHDMHRKGRGRIGSRNPISKLTESDAIAILSDSRPNPQIARQYGVTKTVISSIKRREAWRHVSLPAKEKSNG